MRAQLHVARAHLYCDRDWLCHAPICFAFTMFGAISANRLFRKSSTVLSMLSFEPPVMVTSPNDPRPRPEQGQECEPRLQRARKSAWRRLAWLGQSSVRQGRRSPVATPLFAGLATSHSSDNVRPRKPSRPCECALVSRSRSQQAYRTGSIAYWGTGVDAESFHKITQSGRAAPPGQQRLSR